MTFHIRAYNVQACSHDQLLKPFNGIYVYMYIESTHTYYMMVS